ncbi:hypothetical protein IEQ34_021199 [Dendrobium chrysotoxum]|uniref:Exocyst subunit Exo70 family protein n=1 Tax=Dendrobium chrysotoxum TaxID=161865 RepID=A0AAV7G2V3_DENCH|nr:hypothetical protein IEQ34_021199 [Dendrobium chrysotoxum]
MATATKVDGQDKVIATAQQIVRSLATSKNAAEDMIRILSGFDNRLSSMNDLLPTAGSGCSSPSAGRVDARREVPAAGEYHLEEAEEVIQRWESSDSLLWEASAEEAVEYLDAVDELVSLLESESFPEEFRARAEIAVQIAMARLEDEFRHLMIRNTVPLDADSLHSSIRRVSLSFTSVPGDSVEDFEESVDEDQNYEANLESRGSSFISSDRRIDLVLPEVVSDLKEIADRMIWAGYGKELCQVYSSIRRDILDECLSILGLERMSIEEVQRIEWRALDEKMKKWIQAMKVMVRILLTEEKRLSELIFAISDDIKEECFTGAAKPCILQILNFGDAISICHRSSEKLFRILDMYEALGNVIPELHSLFSAEAKNLICGEAEGIRKRLGDSVRGTFMEFAKDVQKDVSRRPLPGGEIHPLTRYVMNYVKLFVDYSSSLDVLLDDENVLGGGNGDDTQISGSMTPVGRSLLMLMSYLESNLDEKSKHYEDGGLQCIFLMNNIHYMVQKVRDSELLGLLGDNWVRRHRAQVKQYANSYLRASWTKILSYLKDDGLGGSGSSSLSSAPKRTIKEKFKSFNLAFEEIYRTQTTWKVPDSELRDDLCISISERVIPAYRAFLGRFGVQLEAGRQAEKYIKYTAEELEQFISEFFKGSSGPSNLLRKKA